MVAARDGVICGRALFRVDPRAGTEVELGITGQEYFQVLSGLSEGDTVVAGPYQRIRDLNDGDEVKSADPDERGRGRSGR